MSEFEAGDRVKIEFEAVVAEQDWDGTWHVVPVGDVAGGEGAGESIYVLPERMTKVASPLPTKLGAVIESNGYRFMLTRSGWHAHTDSNPWEPHEKFEESEHARDFTVILEGK